MPAISVLIPCYNVASTVNEALSSLVGQTFADFEVVLVDDGSTDGTLDHLQGWSHQDQRFRVLSRSHEGIIPSLNAGLEACRSAIIARLDADDRSTPKRLESQIELLASQPELVVISSLVKGFPEDELGGEFRAYIDWLNSLLTDEEIKHAMFQQSPLAHPSVTYRRAWVERVGGYQDHGWAEDYDLWLRLFLVRAKFGKIPEVLVEWRDHPNRLTHTDGRYSKHSDLRLQAYYLMHGPLSGHKEVMVWGTGIAAYELGKLLLDLGCPLSAYVDAQHDSLTQQDEVVPIISAAQLSDRIHTGQPPILLVVENNLLRKTLILQQLESMHLRQGLDWWVVGSP